MFRRTGDSDLGQPEPARDVSDPARKSLTRVPLDPSLLTLDPAIEWCRHEVRRLIAWHVIANTAAVFVISMPLAWWSFGSATIAVALGLAIAVAATAGRVGIVLVAGRLGFNYVRSFTSSPRDYLLWNETAAVVPNPAESAPDPANVDLWDLDPSHDPLAPAPPATAAVAIAGRALLDESTGALTTDDQPDPDGRRATSLLLHEFGFRHTATVRADRQGAVVDLFSDGDRVVVAADRSSGNLTVLTELAGFRVLVTSALLVPPTDDLVVNVVNDALPAGLVLSHDRLVQQAFRSLTRMSEPVGLFKLAQQRELEAYRELGPFWGAMLDLRCRPRRAHLAAAPLADDILLFTGNRLFQHAR